MPDPVAPLVETLARALCARRLRIATAESCTGGLIAKSCTDLAGSSDWFERGFVTYSNAAKTEMLGVPAPLVADYGAVSEPVAAAMAAGARRHSAAECSVAVTGVAGPAGGSADKPVGSVWIAAATPTQQRVQLYRFDGDRAAIREASCIAALEMLLELLDAE